MGGLPCFQTTSPPTIKLPKFLGVMGLLCVFICHNYCPPYLAPYLALILSYQLPSLENIFLISFYFST